MSTAAPIQDSNGDLQFALAMVDKTSKAGDFAGHAMAIRAVSAIAPTVEIGLMRNDYSGPVNKTLGSSLGWNQFTDDYELTSELKWPQSVKTYDRMRIDSQISGLHRAMTYPIRRFKFMIDPNGARPEVVQQVAAGFNLDVQGEEPRNKGRRKGRFSFDDFLRHALLAPIYGHMYFERWGEPDALGYWQLKGLEPRMPQTIQMINVSPAGKLISIRQNLMRFGAGPGGFTQGFTGPEIPENSLSPFVWEREGANWAGRSMLRDCYRNWVIKDRLLRVDAINHERAGGVPIAEAPAGATKPEMERLANLAKNFRVGDSAGGSVPQGTNFQLHKVGSGTDVIASIQYHDEAMARLMLHMFIQLGQTATGSRALGGAFIEYAFIAQTAVAKWFVDCVNENVIEDWITWNYGEDEQIPLLTFIVEEQNEHLAVADLFQLIECHAVTPDPALEEWLRDKYKMPKRDSNDPLNTIPLPNANDLATAASALAYTRKVEWLKEAMNCSYDEVISEVLKETQGDAHQSPERVAKLIRNAHNITCAELIHMSGLGR